MKKLIDIEDSLYKNIEKIKEGFHLKTDSSVITLALTLGLQELELMLAKKNEKE